MTARAKLFTTTATTTTSI